MSTVDLGRHLANGRFLSSYPEILSHNVYSLTESSQNFANHHWLSGCLFFQIERVVGLRGLHIVLVGLAGVAFICGLWVTYSRGGLSALWLCGIVAIPLFYERNEPRPEIISSIFFVAVFAVLEKIQKIGISLKSLLLTGLIFALWVNFHIFFVIGLGFFLSGLAILVLQKPAIRQRKLLTAGHFVLPLFATFVNPNHFMLWHFMLTRMVDLAYPVAETESSFRNLELFVAFGYYGTITIFLICTWVLIRTREFSSNVLSWTLCLLGFFLSAYQSRYIALWGLCFLLLAPQWIGVAVAKLCPKSACRSTIIAILLAFSTCQLHALGRLKVPSFGPSLASLRGIQFVHQKELRGPVFNSFGVGSFLIGELFPGERVFVDGRPEAYSADFIRNVYIRAQLDEAFWHGLQDYYGFQLIFFRASEQSSWGRLFLRNRLADHKWKLVFRDSFSIIFVPNSPAYQSLLDIREP